MKQSRNYSLVIFILIGILSFTSSKEVANSTTSINNEFNRIKENNLSQLSETSSLIFLSDNTTLQVLPFRNINTDTDGDGVPDATDKDDDNDGILDIDEGCSDALNFPNSDKGFLFQNNEVFTVDILTGNAVKVANLPADYNAVTINEETGMFWAVNQSTNLVEVLSPHTFSVVQTFSGTVNAISGAYDPIRKRYVANNGSSFKVVDADPNSPTYGTKLYTFNNNANTQINDLAYNSNDGYMYGIRSGVLYRVDIINETVISLGNVSGFSGGAGAAYSTNDGLMYFGDNGTGDIYVMDLFKNGASVTLFSNGPASSSNDGAKALGIDLNGNPLCLDTDNDGIPNSLDLDSDNDGCPDALEGGGSFTHTDLNIVDRLTGGVNGQGIPNVVGANGQGIGTSADATIHPCCNSNISNDPDLDNDGVADICDDDDDNDGVLDLNEGCNDFISTFPNADKGYLFQGTEVFTVDIQTGIAIKIATLPTSYNAVIINEETGRFWAINQSTNLVEVLNPYTFSVEQTFSGTINAISAAYDPIRKRYVANNGASFKVVDADPSSSTYGTRLYTFSTSTNINDLAYNSDDGYMYGIRNGVLYRVDIVNQTVTSLGNVSGFSGGAGAAYSTNDGLMYFSENSTGNIYVMDFANTGNSVTLFSNGPASGSNDGAKVLSVDLNGNPLCRDTDKDGIPDSKDVDSDGDGCTDVVESGGVDVNNDGILDGSGINSNNGRVTGGTNGYNGANGSEITAARVLINVGPTNQSKNTGESTTFSVTAQGDEATNYNNGFPIYGIAGNANNNLIYQWFLGNPNTGGTVLDNTGVYSNTNTAVLSISDVTGLANNEYCVRIRHNNNTCIEEIRCAILTVIDPCDPIASGNTDTDGDGIADLCDLDDDNDGILDANEGCATCNSNLSIINGSFEAPSFSGNVLQTDESNVPGWFTTASNNEIELWSSGFRSTPSQEGSYHAEINASSNAALYQQVCTNPGATINWSVWHRGRSGTDVAVVRIGDDLNNAPIQTTMSTGNTAWVQYTGTYTVPSNQAATYFIFEAVSTSTGSIGQGNFIDNVVIQEIISGTCLDTDNDGVINALDLDSDGDGCLDVVESGGIDANNDGKLDSSGFDADGQVTGGTGGYDGIKGGETVAHQLSILTAPTNQTANNGQSATFSIIAQGDAATQYNNGTPLYGTSANDNGSLNYQWYNGNPSTGGTLITNGGVFSGATTNTLTISDVVGLNGTQICAVVTHDNNPCLEEVRCAILSVTTNELCNDGMDNDGDGLIDCADQDCAPVVVNVISRELSCPLGANNGRIEIIAIGQGILEYSITNEPNYQASNVFDNIGQGQYTIRVRSNTGCMTTYNTLTVFNTPSCPEICNDGIDNDGDGLIDCDDADCSNHPITTPITDN